MTTLLTVPLVERRGEDIDVGPTVLVGQAARLARAPLREFCAELVAGRGPARDDGVAVHAPRTPHRPPG